MLLRIALASKSALLLRFAFADPFRHPMEVEPISPSGPNIFADMNETDVFVTYGTVDDKHIDKRSFYVKVFKEAIRPNQYKVLQVYAKRK